MLIILCGAIGRSVTGGQAWANLQYLLGLRLLGHQVYYLEDCGDWSRVYDWEAQQETADLDHPGAYIRDALEPHGFADRWMYRVGDESRGLGIGEFRDVCAAADLLIVRGVPLIGWRVEYDLPRRRVFIDVDPGFTQIRLAQGEPAFVETIGKSERVFTVGQRVGMADCAVPTVGREWLKTLPPVYLREWSLADEPPGSPCTTIVRWRGMMDVSYDGVAYGQRDKEFPKFLALPSMTSQPLRVALTGGAPETLAEHGWQVVPGWRASQTPASYREFIRTSRAEFSVAKHCYVHTRGGWFSDRTVCYLASGRPALVQDTGLTDWLPCGRGLLPFRDAPGAVRRISEMNADYDDHRQAARWLAEQHFASERVLPKFLEAALD